MYPCLSHMPIVHRSLEKNGMLHTQSLYNPSRAQLMVNTTPIFSLLRRLQTISRPALLDIWHPIAPCPGGAAQPPRSHRLDARRYNSPSLAGVICHRYVCRPTRSRSALKASAAQRPPVARSHLGLVSRPRGCRDRPHRSPSGRRSCDICGGPAEASSAVGAAVEARQRLARLSGQLQARQRLVRLSGQLGGLVRG